MTRPDDQQPDSPDLAGAVHLGTADTLDGPAGDGVDALDAGYVPPDRPYVLDEDGVTGAGMRTGDTLDDRLRREEPEEVPVDDDRAGRLVGDGSDTLDAVDVGTDGGAASAEEAAVHEIGLGVEPAETEPSVDAVPALVDPEADAQIAAAENGEPDAFGDALRDVRDDGEFAVPLSTPDGVDGADVVDALGAGSGASAAASGRDDVGPGSGLSE